MTPTTNPSSQAALSARAATVQAANRATLLRTTADARVITAAAKAAQALRPAT